MTQAAARPARRLWQGLVLLSFAAVPAGLCQLTAPAPQDRDVHVRSFRYGKDPSVIRCNRGDRLHLTFSTEDTGHSFFLEEFDLDAKITPGSRRVAVFRARDPSAPPKFQEEVVLEAEHPGWLRYLVSKSQYRCHVWCGPMHAFEQGTLVIRPNTLLFAGLGLLLGIPVVGWIGLPRGQPFNLIESAETSPTEGRNLFKQIPGLGRLMKWRAFQIACIAMQLALLYVVILAAVFGTKMSGRNAGIMLVWVVWLFLLTAVMTPLGGRIWCYLCPLPAIGEALQRGAIARVRTGSTADTNNRFYGLNLAWPQWMASDWPRTGAFLVLGTMSTVLVATPKVTGFVVLGLVVLATAMSLVWRLRAFCRWICPVNAFVGLYSKSAKLALRAADPAVCQRCRLRSCQKGSDTGWACPYGLCVAEIHENNDCGLCAECLRTCPYDNVTLRWRPFGREIGIRTPGEAWMAMAMLVLAASYCAVHLGPWPVLRDYVNILDKGNWGLFAVYAAMLWTTALLAVPAIMLAAAAIGRWLAGTAESARSLMIASTGALVPIGLLLWIAFVVPLVMVNASFVIQSLSDPFGWGWDFFGTANIPWRQIWPGAIPWIQVGCALAGWYYGLRNTWRIWLGLTGDPRRAFRGMMPLAVLLAAFSGSLVWFFAN